MEQIPCPECGQIFTNKSNRDRHCRLGRCKLDQHDLVVCEWCNKELKDAYIERHRRLCKFSQKVDTTVRILNQADELRRKDQELHAFAMEKQKTEVEKQKTEAEKQKAEVEVLREKVATMERELAEAKSGVREEIIFIRRREPARLSVVEGANMFKRLDVHPFQEPGSVEISHIILSEALAASRGNELMRRETVLTEPEQEECVTNLFAELINAMFIFRPRTRNAFLPQGGLPREVTTCVRGFTEPQKMCTIATTVHQHMSYVWSQAMPHMLTHLRRRGMPGDEKVAAIVENCMTKKQMRILEMAMDRYENCISGIPTMASILEFSPDTLRSQDCPVGTAALGLGPGPAAEL